MKGLNKDFQIENKKKISALDSMAYEIIHIPTGMKIIYLDNNDKNKVFSAAFRTPPSDNSGAPHILEHSVLCGSKRYKAKDLFLELMKGSINTFLNAMTYSDKTIYPLASQNEKDFFNLMGVYLDSVFNPLIREVPEFFRQEGWNYGISRVSEPIELRGIVYNEMKGAYDNPERLLIKRIDEVLYKNTPYQYDSGGVPSCIPSLSYEALTDFYNVYYSPSNCLLYLYGELNLDKALEMIGEAVCGHAKTTVPPMNLIPAPRATTPTKDIGYYSVDKQKENGTYFALSDIACEYLEHYDVVCLEILSHILAGNDAAPLRKALVESGVCGDFSLYYRTSSAITSISLVGKNCKSGEADNFRSLVQNTLKTIAKKGIDKSLIEGELNKWEFLIKEEDFGSKPKGLFYGINAISAWVYGGNIYDAMDTKKIVEKIRKDAEDGLFDRILRKYFSDSGKMLLTVLEPKVGLLKNEEEHLRKSLGEFKKSLSKDELRALIRQSKRLDAFRKKPDSKRALNKIPSLRVKDISVAIPRLDFSVSEYGITCVHSQEGIDYVNLSFDLRHVPAKLLPYCGLLTKILGKTATKSYTAEELINRLDMYAGAVRFEANAIQNADGICFPLFHIKLRSLEKNTAEVLRLIAEAVSPKLNVEMVGRIVRETLAKTEDNFLSNGHSVSSTRCLSYIFSAANYRDLFSGIGFYDEICGKSYEEITENVKKAAEIIFQKENLFTATSSFGKRDISNVVGGFGGSLYYSGFCKTEKAASVAINLNKNEGFILDGGVCFNSLAFNLYDAADRYTGKLQVAKSVLNLYYLWPEIRNKGGAYGCGSGITRDGSLFFYSYRDPELRKTYDVFSDSFSSLKEYKAGRSELEKYIINAIKPFERPLKPHEALDASASNHLLGINDDIRQLERNELLSCSPDDINIIGETLETLTENEINICTLGCKPKIEAENLFNNVRSLRLT